MNDSLGISNDNQWEWNGWNAGEQQVILTYTSDMYWSRGKKYRII